MALDAPRSCLLHHADDLAERVDHGRLVASARSVVELVRVKPQHLSLLSSCLHVSGVSGMRSRRAMCVPMAGRRWACVPVARRGGRGHGAAQDHRDLQRLLSEMQRGGSAREG